MHAGRTARISLDSSKSPEREQQLQIKPASEHVGAEITDVNLAIMPNGVFEKIEDAYNRYSLLIFRDQELSPEQQIAFARRFGELEISPRTQFALPGYPEILVLSNIIENGKPIGNADAGRTWHTDMSYTKTPPRGGRIRTALASAPPASPPMPKKPPWMCETCSPLSQNMHVPSAQANGISPIGSQASRAMVGRPPMARCHIMDHIE
jgi:hypothetical protein